MFSSSTECLFRVIRSGSGSLNEGNLFLSKTSSWEEQVIDVLIAKSSYTLVTRSSNKLIESFHLWWFRLQCKYPMLFHHFLLFAFPLYLMMRSEVELSGWATRGSRKKLNHVDCQVFIANRMWERSLHCHWKNIRASPGRWAHSARPGMAAEKLSQLHSI